MVGRLYEILGETVKKSFSTPNIKVSVTTVEESFWTPDVEGGLIKRAQVPLGFDLLRPLVQSSTTVGRRLLQDTQVRTGVGHGMVKLHAASKPEPCWGVYDTNWDCIMHTAWCSLCKSA